MSLKQVEIAAVVKSAAMGVGGESSDPLSPALVAALLRRAAWFECPCAPRALKRAVAAALQPLIPAEVDAMTVVEEVLDSLVSLGDLVEEREQSEVGSSRRLLYISSASYVPTGAGKALVLGIGPSGGAPVPEALKTKVEIEGLSRVISPYGLDDREQLLQAGLVEVSYEQWAGSPTGGLLSASAVITRCEEALRGAPGAEQEFPIEVIDSHRDPLYYKGRWSAPGQLSGLHVARREVRFGADRWCLAHLEHGKAVHLVDLPVIFEGQRGCDEAWIIQAAIDAERTKPQRYRLALSPDGWSVEVFSPLPSWVKRTWEFEGVAIPVERGRGRTPLAAYRFRGETVARLNAARLERELWMQPLT